MQYRVCILIQGKDIAASRYRILQYIPFLESRGAVCDVQDVPSSVGQYLSLLKDLHKYDCLFVQRKRVHFPFIRLVRSRAKRIIYDLDDAIMYRNSLGKAPYSKTRERRFRTMVMASDVVIAGNSFLEEKVREYSSNVVVIPTSIPIERYSMKKYPVKKDIVTIGWIGDHGSIHYLDRLRPVWDEIGRKYPGRVELKIICDTFFDCEDIPVRKIPWSSDTEVEELGDIDIGVMPLMDDPWSWGKCGLKILQYYGVGVPAVCTPVGINRDVVTDGINGFWARSHDEWIRKIEILVRDGTLRATMGTAGRRTLDDGFSDLVNAPRILEAIMPESCLWRRDGSVTSPGRGNERP